MIIFRVLGREGLPAQYTERTNHKVYTDNFDVIIKIISLSDNNLKILKTKPHARRYTTHITDKKISAQHQ